jgi:DNA (cytosine-5)-methyltransferase 1
MSASDTVEYSKEEVRKRLTFIDLFCGCGGFTLGMLRAGFECLAAIDNDKTAIETLRKNLGVSGDLPPLGTAVQADLTKLSPRILRRKFGIASVDVIVGGPPCQGFSTARQVDGANHGERLKHDARRLLYKDFLRFVDYYRPKVFVIENVLGIRTAANGKYFTQVQADARRLKARRGVAGYRVHAQMEDAWALGVPQKRRRQLIIGVRCDVPDYFVPELRHPARSTPFVTLGPAIDDLPIVKAGDRIGANQHDPTRRRKSLEKYGASAVKYLRQVAQVHKSKQLANHFARPHSDRDLRDFRLLGEGETSATAMRRGVVFEFPYDKENFKDRYTRQSRHKPCSTIVAHLSKDGLMFIHPTQTRSLTPREAARVQSFPDWFVFPQAQTPAYRLIGNAVPPLVGEAIGNAVAQFLLESKRLPRVLPRKAAVSKQFAEIVELDRRGLRDLPHFSFLEKWHTVLASLPHVHPANVADHGEATESWEEGRALLPTVAGSPSVKYVRSGWPVVLEEFGREAWRRLSTGRMTKKDFYKAVD